jgi:hypothetical protein
MYLSRQFQLAGSCVVIPLVGSDVIRKAVVAAMHDLEMIVEGGCKWVRVSQIPVKGRVLTGTAVETRPAWCFCPTPTTRLVYQALSERGYVSVTV